VTRTEVPKRLRRFLDAVAVVGCELLLFVFFLRSSGLLGSVDFSHLSAWSQGVSPEGAFTAIFRSFGLVVSGWLLLSTFAYVVALLSGSRRLLKGSTLVTLPPLRRLLDAVAVASVAAATLSVSAGRQAPVSRPVPAVFTVRSGQQAGPPAKAVTVRASKAPSGGALMGRHLPHPGDSRHVAPGPHDLPDVGAEVPSAGNGFAGLPAGTKVVVVEPGDCLSVLAEHHLGDWRLDAQIAALNYGRPQADGRALVDDHWIYPGWVLVMPADAVGTLVVGTHPHTGLPERGAGGHDRDGGPTTRAGTGGPELSHPVPGSPGQVRRALQTRFTVGASTPRSAPADLTAPVTPPATAPASSPATAHASAPAAVPGTAPGTAPGPARATSRRGGPGPGERPATGPPRAEGPRGASAGRVEGRPGPKTVAAGNHTTLDAVVPIGGAAAIAVAGVVLQLERKRRGQAHARRTGFLVPRNSPPVEAAERRARVVATSEALMWADLSLRYLGGLVEQACDGPSAEVPSLVLMRVGDGGVEVVMSPEPHGRFGWFSPTGRDGSLALDADIGLEDLRALADERWPVWPAVVSLGQDRGGAVLFNLEHAGSLSVEGPARQVSGALSSLALQLVSQPWCDEMLSGLYCLGRSPLGTVPGLEGLEGPGVVQRVEKLVDITNAREQMLGGLPISALRAVACEALPHVVVAFEDAPEGLVPALAKAAERGHGLAVACAGPYAGARWHLELGMGTDALLHGELDGQPVHYALAMDWDPEETALLSNALGAAAETDGVPMDGSSGARPKAESRDQAADNGQAPASGASRYDFARGDAEISVLGPVDLIGGDPSSLEPSRRTPALAVIAYLAAHPRAVSAEELGSNLWPLGASRDDLGAPQRKTVMNVVSRARALLGYGRGGRERILHSAMGYSLADDVTCDLDRFEKMVAIANRQGQHDALAGYRRALELVRGQPFGGVISSQFFEWVASEQLDFTVQAKVVDVAQRLAELATEEDDFETVRWAVEKGLLLEPTREELFRLWMHALGREGRAGMVDDVYRRLKFVLRQKLSPLAEPREETRAVWLHYTSPEVTRT